MSLSAKIEVENNDILASIQEFLSSILQMEDVNAILVPQRLPMKNVVMPMLISDPERLTGVDPLAPYFPMNAAKIVSKLTRKAFGGRVAVVLRPCEIRAFTELVKLNQGQANEVITIGLDCLGAYNNMDYLKSIDDDAAAFTLKFHKSMLAGNGSPIEQVEPAPACSACEHPIPETADVLMGFLGMNPDNEILVQAQTPSGEQIINRLGLPETEVPASRKSAIDALVLTRTEFRNKMYEQTKTATENLEKLTVYLANCVNCYNCRVACPVCYCKECVFVTDVFNHEPSQYLQWSRNKGAVKLPTDTVFYHITRLAHMSTACVGCGQCSNACPNDIPVMELFRTVAQYSQSAFNYEAGRNMEERPPLSVFREEEFGDVVGIH